MSGLTGVIPMEVDSATQPKEEETTTSLLLRSVHHPSEARTRQWSGLDMMQRDIHTGNIRGKAYPPEIVARACTRLARGESIREVSKALRVSESWLHVKRKQIEPYLDGSGTCTVIPSPMARSGGRRNVMTLEQQRALMDMAVRMRSRPVHKLVDDMKERFPELSLSVSTAQRCLRTAGVRMIKSREVDPKKGLGSAHEEQIREFVSAQANDLFDPFKLLFLDESTFSVLSSTQKIYSTRKEETSEVTKGVGDGFSVIAAVMLRPPGSKAPSTLTPKERARLQFLGLNIATPEQEAEMILFWGILTVDGLRAPATSSDSFTKEDRENRMWTYKDEEEREWRINVDHAYNSNDHFVLNELDVGKQVIFKTTSVTVGDKERYTSGSFVGVELDKQYIILEVSADNKVLLQGAENKLETENVKEKWSSAKTNPTSLAGLKEAIETMAMNNNTSLLANFLVRNGVKATIRTSSGRERFMRQQELKMRALEVYAFLSGEDASIETLPRNTISPFSQSQHNKSSDFSPSKASAAPFAAFLETSMQYIRHFISGVKTWDELVPRQEWAPRLRSAGYGDSNQKLITEAIDYLKQVKQEGLSPFNNTWCIDVHMENNKKSYKVRVVEDDKDSSLMSVDNEIMIHGKEVEWILKTLVRRIPLKMAWDNASSHGAVEVTSNTKSWIHEWVASTLGIEDAIFMPPLDPKYNPVELLFNYTKGFVRQEVKARRVGSLTKPELLTVLKNAFQTIRQEHLVNWLQMGCYRVPEHVARRAGLFPNMQIVGDGVAMNKDSGKLVNVSKRCQVMYEKVLPKYHRFRCITDDLWLPYTPGYEMDEADLLFCLNLHVEPSDKRTSFFLSWNAASKTHINMLNSDEAKMCAVENVQILEGGSASCDGTCRINFLTNLVEATGNTPARVYLRSYATHHAPLRNISDEKNKALEMSSQRVETLANILQSQSSRDVQDDRSEFMLRAAEKLAEAGCSTLPEFKMHRFALDLGGPNSFLSASRLSELQLIHPMTAEQAAASAAWDDFDKYKELKAQVEQKQRPAPQGGLALFQKSRIACTLVRAWACQLAFILVSAATAKYNLNAERDIGVHNGNWMRLAREFGLSQTASKSSDKLNDKETACLKSLAYTIESHFHGFKQQLRNVLYLSSDNSQHVWTHRTAADAVLFALKLSDVVEQALDHSEHRITEILQKVSANADRAAVKQTVHRFLRFQYSTISQNPFELCASQNARGGGTFTCVASTGKAVLRRDGGYDTVLDASKMGELLAALNVSHTTINPQSIRQKEEQRRLKKTSAWGHKYTGVPRGDGVPSWLYPDPTSKSSITLMPAPIIPVDIKNVWTKDELALVLARIHFEKVDEGLRKYLTYQVNTRIVIDGKGIYEVRQADLFRAIMLSVESSSQTPTTHIETNKLTKDFIGELHDGSIIAFDGSEATHHRVKALVHLAKERSTFKNIPPTDSTRVTRKVIWSYDKCRVTYDESARFVIEDMSKVCIVLDAKAQRIDLNKIPRKEEKLSVAIRRPDDTLFQVRIEQHVDGKNSSLYDMEMTRLGDQNAPIFVTNDVNGNTVSLLFAVPGFRHFLRFFTFTYPKNIQPLIYEGTERFTGFDVLAPRSATEVRNAHKLRPDNTIIPGTQPEAFVCLLTVDENINFCLRTYDMTSEEGDGSELLKTDVENLGKYKWW